jgi:hypothetical protein
MVTDGCSFLTEYPISTEKPLIYIDSGVHQEFNLVGKLAENYSNRVTTFSQIESYLLNPTTLKKTNADPILNYLLPNRDNTAKKIIENLLNSL